MFVSLKPSVSITGVDFSYTTSTNRMVSLYLSSVNSMIVEPKFIDVITMVNGMFTKQQILDYMRIALGYSEDKCQDIEKKVSSWDVLEEKPSMTNWGEDMKQDLECPFFSQYDIGFSDIAPEQVDLVLMMAKYGFGSYRFTKDLKITEDVLNSSLLLDYADLDMDLSQILANRYKAVISVGKDSIVEKETGCCVLQKDTIYNEDTVTMGIRLRDYTDKTNLGYFNLFGKAALENHVVRSFAKNINIANDIIFSLASGLYC